MCGIVAFKGNKKKGSKVIFDGLKLLEYRGYDSCGIGVIDDNEIKTFKWKGRVLNTEKKFKATKIQPQLAIGHTRWATHGVPNNANAHPIISFKKEFAIVHNGIIENYKELKKVLKKEGYKFFTDTDTEVMVNFIELCVLNSDSIDKGISYALSRIEGAFGIVLIKKSDPDIMYAARKGSPLAFGKKGNNFFIASDATPIIEYTKKIIYLENGHLLKINGNDFEVFDFNLNKMPKEFKEVDIELQKVELGDFESYMLKEIMEQPDSLSQTMLGRVKNNNITLGGIQSYTKPLINTKRIIIIGCGTSWHAGLVAEYFFEKYIKVPVEVEYASEFRYRFPIINKGDIVFVISQSGETADTLEATRIAKKKGAIVLGIVNAVGSSIARITDEGCYLHAGPEIGVASTKAFTSQLMVLLMIGIKVALIKKNITTKKFHKMISEIQQIPKKINEALKESNNIKKISKKIFNKNHALFLGRGNNFPVALEGALKLKEISYIHAEGYPAAEMKHGPIALIDKEMPVIAICTKSDEYDKMISNIREVGSRNAIVIGVIDKENDHVKDYLDYSIMVPSTSKDFTPIINQIPLQLLAYHCAVLRGCDVDKPRNLAKSVTVE
ncbi:MAG: glutamine--fructose-6-phosphate transaminase (isomerizing) [Cytophagales bacterium]|nr:MAG: glutamine--fructose-6-phosphate transaminase (isomerizing) [Rhodothermaeota bacterium MED-G18]